MTDSAQMNGAIDPSILSRHVPHPTMAAWDAERIARARAAYLERARLTFADRVLSAAELLAEPEADD